MVFTVKYLIFGPAMKKEPFEAKELEKYINMITKTKVLYEITEVFKLISCVKKNTISSFILLIINFLNLFLKNIFY